jgi:aspartate kinase
MPGDAVHFEKERGVTDVSVTRGVAHVRVLLEEAEAATGRLTLLKRLAAANVPVFLVKLQRDGISFALREAQTEAGAALLKEEDVPHVLARDLALVTIIAGAMRDLSGIMAMIYEALVSEGIGVWQTGDAYNAVHCLVSGADAERAADALRAKFALIPPPATGQNEGVGLKAL